MNECNIIMDLLPLYAEELTSLDSREYIENHLKYCASCRDLWRRYRKELPEMDTAQNLVKEYKTGLRKDKWRIALLTLFGWILTAVIAIGIFCYRSWENGDFSEGKLYSAPDGIRSIELVDLENAGFFDTEGSQVRFRFERGFLNRYSVDWKDLVVHWAPDSRTALLVIQTNAGETELRIVDHKDGLPDGGTYDIPGLIPSEEAPDLTKKLAQLCAVQPGFPDAEGDISFTFLAWEEDSETIVVSYELDNGKTGFLSYHFPTEKIIEIG